MAPIRVALLGSTGSIGRQTLDVITSAGPEAFRVTALAARRDVRTFQAQLSAVRPPVAALTAPEAARQLQPPRGTALEVGPEALESFAVREDVDMVVVATGGIVWWNAVSNTATCRTLKRSIEHSIPAKLAGLCSGAKMQYLRIVSTTLLSMSVGSKKSGPPCVTRWPIAVRSSALSTPRFSKSATMPKIASL